jgi:Holliday junction resolvase RusA-like endonuclease
MTTTLASFDIIGLPAPQGSKSVMPGGRLVEGSSTSGRLKHKSWRAAVAEASRELAGDEPHDGPLTLQVTFRLPMPASRPKRIQVCGEWPKSTKPDLDKLVRALCDGMEEGGLIRDDSRIYAIDAMKLEVVGWTGAEVTLKGWAL